MKYFATPDYAVERLPAGAKNYPIFLDEQSPIAGCNSSVGHYYGEEYPVPGVHEDHEGFFVISGSGKAKVGEEESTIAAGSFFYAPAGIPHAIKKDVGTPELKIVMFHFPKQ